MGRRVETGRECLKPSTVHVGYRRAEAVKHKEWRLASEASVLQHVGYRGMKVVEHGRVVPGHRSLNHSTRRVEKSRHCEKKEM
jgi:hypothetical protein